MLNSPPTNRVKKPLLFPQLVQQQSLDANCQQVLLRAISADLRAILGEKVLESRQGMVALLKTVEPLDEVAWTNFREFSER